MIRIALAAVAVLTLAGLPVHAAPTDTPMAVGSLALPMPKALFRHVASNGTTKPAGAALDRRNGTTPDLDRRSRELHRLIATSICTGC